MIFEQFHLQCLSHASYLMGEEGTKRAVVVDPQRDASIYLHAAEARGLTIERVIETHPHADFLSGHLELADPVEVLTNLPELTAPSSHLTVAQLRERIATALANLDPAAPTVLYCASGYRSAVAASVLRAAGVADVSDLVGGYDAWTAAGAKETAGA